MFYKMPIGRMDAIVRTRTGLLQESRWTTASHFVRDRLSPVCLAAQRVDAVQSCSLLADTITVLIGLTPWKTTEPVISFIAVWAMPRPVQNTDHGDHPEGDPSSKASILRITSAVEEKILPPHCSPFHPEADLCQPESHLPPATCV